MEQFAYSVTIRRSDRTLVHGGTSLIRDEIDLEKLADEALE